MTRGKNQLDIDRIIYDYENSYKYFFKNYPFNNLNSKEKQVYNSTEHFLKKYK